MTHTQIKTLQAHIGFTGDAIDGFWGPKSVAKCQAYLKRLMPSPNPWPKQSQVREFFGEPGDENNLVTIDVPKGFTYDGKPVTKMRCHKLVAESLKRILPKILPFVTVYDGCFNFRKMRGGSSYSMHSWGIAVDFDAGNNGNTTHWPTRATMPIEVMEEFAKEGWTPAGAFWSRDAMHFQATQP